VLWVVRSAGVRRRGTSLRLPWLALAAGTVAIAPEPVHVSDLGGVAFCAITAMDDSPRNAVGPQIRKLRFQLERTQAFLAERLQLAGWDCTRSLLAKIEAQQVWVADFELLYFAKVFKMTLEDLFPSLDPGLTDPRGRKQSRRIAKQKKQRAD
jgi:transcriptional regulator with XRE-family HTH domain